MVYTVVDGLVLLYCRISMHVSHPMMTRTWPHVAIFVYMEKILLYRITDVIVLADYMI